MQGTELVVKALQDKGVRTIFGYTGGAIMPFLDEVGRQDSIRFIMSRHEQGAAFMAQGLSRGSASSTQPQLGICVATSGPGAMNLVTGVADAGMDSVPLLAITGQVASGVIATDAFQESDVVGVMMPLAKQVYMPLKVEVLEETLHEAWYLASTGRGGPVVVDIPKDIQFATAESDYAFDPGTYEPDLPGFLYSPHPSPEAIGDAVELLNEAQAPVILCGHGVIGSRQGANLQKLAEAADIPIAFTFHGLSAIPVDHPLSLGMVGMHGTVEANRALEHADLLIALGMRFDDRVTGKVAAFCPDAKVIHVDIDPSEIDKIIPASVAVNADLAQALPALIRHPKFLEQKRTDWLHRIDGWRQEMAATLKAEIEKGTGKGGQLLMKTVVSQLSETTQGKDLIVADVGQHQMICARFYNYQTVNSWFSSGGAGTMGCSLPMAIGVKLARPDERVWSVSGDGGFQMNIQELGTVMEYKIDIKILLLNNRFLGMVRQWQTLFFDGHYAGTPMKSPDYGPVAQGYGIPYRKVETVEEIAPALQWAADHDGPCMVEFLCDPSEIVLPMVPAGGSISDMITEVEEGGAS